MHRIFSSSGILDKLLACIWIVMHIRNVGFHDFKSSKEHDGVGERLHGPISYLSLDKYSAPLRYMCDMATRLDPNHSHGAMVKQRRGSWTPQLLCAICTAMLHVYWGTHGLD